MSFGDYLEKKVLDHVFGKSAYTPPIIFLALSTTEPADDGTNLTEPDAEHGYERVETDAADWNAAAGTNPTVVTNANPLSFPVADDDWGEVGWFALYDAAEAGNFLGSGAITVPKTIEADDWAVFGAGQIAVALA